MQRTRAILLLLAFGLTMGCQKLATPKQRESVATVNGENISAEDFETILTMAHGREVIARLVEDKLILQEAKRDNLSVTDAELAPMLDPVKAIYKDFPIPGVIREEASAGLLLHKIALKDVSEEQKRQFYAQYREALQRYELFQIYVANPDLAQQVTVALHSGTPFQSVAQTSSTDARSKDRGGRVGFATRRVLVNILGAQVAATILAAQDGKVTEPIRLTKRIWAIYKIGKRLSSYEELRPVIDDIFFHANLAALIYRLNEKGDVSSPYLPKMAGANVPLPQENPVTGAPPTGDASPLATPEEHPTPLVAPDLEPPPAIPTPEAPPDIAPPKDD